MNRFKYCKHCGKNVEEKWWDCEPCEAAKPRYSALHEFLPQYNIAELVRETEDYILIRHNPDADPSKYKRALCIGGRFTGQKLSSFEIEGTGYTQFNRADRSTGRHFKMPKTVFLHESVV